MVWLAVEGLVTAIGSGVDQTVSSLGERIHPPFPQLRAASMVWLVSSGSCSINGSFDLSVLHLLEPVCRSWGPFVAEGSQTNTGLVLVCCLASQISESLGIATRLA
jgi:hypothetical protein